MISTRKMKELEDNCGIAKIDLMENAGKGIVDVLEKKFDMKGKKTLVVCYHGNNGGDGFVAARYLAKKADIGVLFIGDESKFKPEALENFNKLKEDVHVQFISIEFVDFDDYDIIIDALLGTGAGGTLRSPFPSVIQAVNKSKAYKISVDVPTGINPDDGKKSDLFIDPNLLITFHDIKTGLKDFKEKTIVVDIGISKSD